MQNMRYLHRVDAVKIHKEEVMPIYEYKCNDCHNIFEVLTTSSTNLKNVPCSKCQSTNVNKVISAGSIRLGSKTSLASAPTSGCGGKSGFS